MNPSIRPRMVLATNFSKFGRGTAVVSGALSRLPSFDIATLDLEQNTPLRGPFISLFNFLRLVWLIFSTSPSIVLVDTAQGFRIASLVRPIFPSVKFVARCGTIYKPPSSKLPIRNRIKAWLYRKILMKADSIIVPSNAAREALIRHGLTSCSGVSVIPNGTVLAPGTVNFDAELPVRLLFVGRLSQQKRPDVAIEALRFLRSELGKNAHLDIFGAGPLHNDLQAKINILGLSKHATLHGFSPTPWANLPTNSMLVFPSMEDGFGFAVLEAIAKGVPVFAFLGSGGPEETVRITGGGVIVRLNDPIAIAKEVALLHDNPEGLTMIMRKAARIVEQVYSRETMIANYNENLVKLAGQRDD